MVFCCFNGLHKITPFIWEQWLSILRQTPGSVLWLLDGIESTNKRLTEMLTTAGIEPNRLVFAPKQPNPEHLARYPLADLFLQVRINGDVALLKGIMKAVLAEEERQPLVGGPHQALEGGVAGTAESALAIEPHAPSIRIHGAASVPASCGRGSHRGCPEMTGRDCQCI